jgi:tetratricopeptide (TPR) repeat protein
MRSLMLAIPILVMTACAEHKHSEAPHLYYGHFYTEARELVRADAADRDSADIILNNMRLGMSAMAWGDLDEAQRALITAYEYLTSGDLNDPARQAAAQVGQEGVRIWTGEPYERAMCFYYMATLYMLKGEWDNARAAAKNSLFELRQFKGDSDEEIAMVESQFTLGYLLLGLSQKMTGNDEAAKRPLAQVEQLQPALRPLVERIRSGSFDTILMVDYGRGPRKSAHGLGGHQVQFTPIGPNHPPQAIRVRVDGQPADIATDQPTIDLWTLSQLPRWWSLDTWRQAKAYLGDGLTKAGMAAVIIGADEDSKEAVIAGAGAIVAGLLLQASAQADVRHLAELPRHTFIVPLSLGPAPRDVQIGFTGDHLSGATWHNLCGGQRGNPTVYYLRAHDGNYGGMPQRLPQQQYFTEHDPKPADAAPFILGGRDLSPPTDSRLVELHRAEGIVSRPGPQGRTGAVALDPALYRHVVEGGRVLWSPRPGTHGYERLTRTSHRPYQPTSPTVQQLQLRNEPSVVPSTTIEGRPEPSARRSQP